MLDSSELFWLTLTVYHEARGESPEGQKAVVKVILNRSKSKKSPISKIVLARKQFSCYNEGLESPTLWIRELETFRKLLLTCQEGYDEWLGGDALGGATHYYALKGMLNKTPPYWASSMKVITEINNHIFLKEG